MLVSEPTIVMIGGRVELFGGTTIDTRQPIATDPWDATQRAACFRSEQWWTKVMSLCVSIMSEGSQAGDRPWALVWAPKSLYVTQSNGDVKRRGLRSFIGTADSADLTGKDHHDENSIRYDQTEATWRILEHKFGFEALQGTSRPAVFVSSGHDLACLYEPFDPTLVEEPIVVDALMNRPKAVAPFDAVAELMDDLLILLPDTPVLRRQVDAYLSWRQGNRWEAPETVDEPDVLKRISDTRPAVIDADFQITRWIDEGVERAPEDLEGAHLSKAAGDNGNIALWDLARDPIHRNTLLTPTPIPSLAGAVADLPSEVQNSMSELRDSRQAVTDEMHDHRGAVHLELWPRLQQHAELWNPIDAGDRPAAGYHLPVGDPFDQEWGAGTAPLLVYRLETLKRGARLKLAPGALPQHHNMETVEFLSAHADVIERIVGRSPVPADLIVAVFKGYGWADEPEDRAAFLETVFALLEALDPEVAAFHSRLAASYRDWQSDHLVTRQDEVDQAERTQEDWTESGIEVSYDPSEGDLTLDVGALEAEAHTVTDEAVPKRAGLLGRIFGRG